MESTLLYVPAHERYKVAHSLTRGAGGVIIDLEDSVPDTAKELARLTATRWLEELEFPPPSERNIWIRVNSQPQECQRDLASLEGVLSQIRGLVVPKAQDDSKLSAVLKWCRDARTESGGPSLIALIETARGFMEVSAIAGKREVTRLGIGEADLAGEVGLRYPLTSEVACHLRMKVVLASRSAGKPRPVGPMNPNFSDLESLFQDTRILRDQGFRSRTVIHPAQIPVVERAFSLDRMEAEALRDLSERAREAKKEGKGAFVDGKGRMIDRAMLDWLEVEDPQ